MKVLIQRVLQASVEINEETVGAIGSGILAFIGITHSDTLTEAEWLANKLIHLRIFEDSNGKTNRSLIECQGAVLVISQFTLYADCTDGRRPSFSRAAPPEFSNALYLQFIELLKRAKIPVETGIFGAQMKVSLVNDGPFTVLLERD